MSRTMDNNLMQIIAIAILAKVAFQLTHQIIKVGITTLQIFNNSIETIKREHMKR